MGEPNLRAYLNKAGEATPDLNLRVSEIVLLGSKSESNTTNNPSVTTNNPPASPVGEDGDLPF